MRKSITSLFAFLVLTTAASVPAAAQSSSFQARVVGVSDGDTLTVLEAGNRQIKIRLFGVDAPETAQDFGSRSKQATSELVFGKTVTVIPHDTDRYGRTVADVRLPDGRLLNHELVGLGLAWWYRQYAPADRELSRLEAEAKAAKRGLWAQAGAVPPWEWRTAKREGRRTPKATAAETASGPVVGNRRSHVYHRPTCRAVSVMKSGNKVGFKSAREAEMEGYRKAGDCWK